MNTPCELITFMGTEYAQKFIYVYWNVVNNNFHDEEKDERIVDYLGGAVFYGYFDCFTQNNATIEETKHNGVVKKVMIENFSTQKAGS